MEYFNFLENHLAAAEAPISTASLPNSAYSYGEYICGFFLSESQRFLAALYLTLHTLHNWLTQSQPKEFCKREAPLDLEDLTEK